MDLSKGFYGITMENDSIGTCKKLIDFGAKAIQYRAKNLPSKQMLYESLEIRELTKKANVLMIVNDRLDLALVVGADGVHVGQDDIPPSYLRKIVPKGFIIGLSTHSLDQVLSSEVDFVDYIGVGAVFKTSTKDAVVIGPDLAQQMVKSSKKPAYLIGGIKLSNIDSIKGIGAYGFTSITDVLYNDYGHFLEMLNKWNS
ncbi:Thiamin-phosphate pyrophosphorylase [Desulfurella amilsii]|uniref:Thiamine-phosphate synthase n=1 Tax=Desulfurella amilsii TaxID=1562698 RepID=A0A1X4XXA9_9BACT|nr:thiamine phosphate synthase [Desulfurella amilsii]OSS42169.1 Thiamin-phosphate pyrophosphorylase [Desulfurella amilsii]